MSDCPSYLLKLRRPRTTLEAAFADCVAAFADHPIPSSLCRQCFEPEWEQQIIAAAREVHAGKSPDWRHYCQIYFEHPNCGGGEGTIKLFTPFGLRDLLTGSGSSEFGYCEVLESLVMAGFWFWPEDQRAVVRDIALCLFQDWFKEGRYDWPAPDCHADDTLGPGDDILSLCTLCQIDPFDIVRVLCGLHTPQADAAMAGPLNFSVKNCTYVAQDTLPQVTVYQDATTAIAQTLEAREAAAYIAFVTKEWVDAAFFRNEVRAPEVAKDLYNFGRYYDVRMVQTREASRMPLLESWPDLPSV